MHLFIKIYKLNVLLVYYNKYYKGFIIGYIFLIRNWILSDRYNYLYSDILTHVKR